MAAPGRRASGPARESAKRAVDHGPARALQTNGGVVRGQLSDIQRARILSATFDICSERGASNVTVAHVAERSGVSRRTFYEQFSDRNGCLSAAFEQALKHASERVLPAYEAEEGWREKIRAGLLALLVFLDEERPIGKLLIVEPFGGGTATLERRNEVVGKLTQALEQGRGESKAPQTIPPLTEEGLLGGVLTVLHSRLAETRHEPLIELTNPLMSTIVLPYLGSAAARRELQRPLPPAPSSRKRALGRAVPLPSEPFKDTGMRLTYRTVQVLTAVSDHPGASNRLIADTAEVNDQGQISKLLMRLERIGMISNTGVGPGQGFPNAWTLTADGHRVVSTIAAHTEGWPGSDER